MSIKRAIVTGASSGIGAAIAKALCVENVEVIAVARNKDNLSSVKRSLPRENQKYFKVITADISNASDIRRILKAARPINKVDILINSAGFGSSKSFEKHTEVEIESIISTNLTGTVNLTHSVLKGRSKSSNLQIVFVSSLAGKIGFPDLSVYSATKFGLEGFAEALRSEYKGKNVRITVLRPGVTDTNFFKVAGAKKPKQLHSSESVAKALLKNIDKSEIIVGGDKYFIKLIPFVPFNKRIKVLGFTNKLELRGN